MYYNQPISSHEMFETYKNQYNQLIEHINQISRDQREIFHQITLNNERLVTNYNYNSQNIGFLYSNLDSLRLNMYDIYRPITTTQSSHPPQASQPPQAPQTPQPPQTPPTTPNPNYFNQPSQTPQIPPTTPTSSTPLTSSSSRSGSRYNIEFLYSYIPSQENRELNSEMVDVPIYPTLEQINNAVTNIPFSSIQNPLNERCPIRLENFGPNDIVSQIISCGHVFSSSGIQEWFQSNVHCPVCRYDIRDYNPTGNNISNNNNNRTRNRTRNRVRNNESSIFNEVMTQFLTSYLDPSYNVDLSFNNLHT